MISRFKISHSDINLAKALPYRKKNKKGTIDFSNVVVQKPWGEEHLLFINDLISIWLLFIKPNSQTSMHCHVKKKTSIVVLSGSAECRTLNGMVRLGVGEGVIVDKGVFHSTHPLTNEGVLVMETESPVDKLDLVRLEDLYGRLGKGYEGKKYLKARSKYEHFSFLDEEMYLGTKRKLGMCEISIVRFDSNNKFVEAISSMRANIIFMIKGYLLNKYGKKIMIQGDIGYLGDLIKMGDLQIKDKIELLIIKN